MTKPVDMKKIMLLSFYYAILFFCFLTGCKKSSSITNNPTPTNPIGISTTTPYLITTTTSISGGTITGNGVDSVTERGICYNTATGPTVLNQKIISGIGSGAFACIITGLLPNTTYYVRAYAKVSSTYLYGNEIPFRTNAVIVLPSDTATLIFASGGYSKKLLALNATDGSLKWTVTLGGNVTASPIYSKGRVFVGCWDNKVYAYDTLGLLKWSTQLTGNIYGNSPVMGNDIVYISTSTGAYALNANNGSIMWSFVKPGGSTLLTIKNNVVYYNSQDSLYAIDASSGLKKWGYYAGENPSVPPVVFTDRTYVISYSNTLSALNTATGAEIWKKPSYSFTADDPEGLNVKNGNIYITTDNLVILDSATGTFKSSTAASPHIYAGIIEYGDGISPLIIDSLVFIPEHRLYIYDAYTGQWKASLPTRAGTNYGLTVIGNIVYYTSSLSDVILPNGGIYQAGFVYAYNYKTQTVVWQTECRDIDFIGPSPCAVTRSGLGYRGGLSNN